MVHRFGMITRAFTLIVALFGASMGASGQEPSRQTLEALQQSLSRLREAMIRNGVTDAESLSIDLKDWHLVGTNVSEHRFINGKNAASVTIGRSDGTIYCFGWRRMPEPEAAKRMSEAELVVLAKDYLKALWPSLTEWRCFETSMSFDQFTASMDPLVEGVPSTARVAVQLNRRDGGLFFLRSFRQLTYPPLNRSKLAPMEQAEQAAWNAYSRYQPFEAAQLVSGELVVGLPLIGEGIPNELLESHREKIRDFVAMPMYHFMVANAYSDKSLQHIWVDAETLRVLVVWRVEAFGASATAAKGPPERFAARAGDWSAELVADATRRAPTDLAGLPVVLMQWNDQRLIARQGEGGILWIRVGKEHRAYQPAEGSTPLPESATVKPGTWIKSADGK